MTQIIDDNSRSEFPASPLSLYFALARGTFTPHEIWGCARFRRKFFLRGLVMPGLTYQMLKIVTRHACYADLLVTQPRLPCRIHRPYLSSKLGRHEGVKAIVHHYEKMTRFLGDNNFRQHLSASGMTIASVTGKNNEAFSLKLISTHKLDREGEVSIIMRDAAGQMLSEISFTLCRRFAEDALIIGGLQGPNSRDAQERIHQATKSFHGLFPKRIVLEALLHIARLLQVEAVYAVSNTTHVYQSLRYNSRKKYMHADYDSMWEVCGGVRLKDSYFRLPLNIQRKSIDDIVSKKRAEYRRRFDLLDDIGNQIFSCPGLIPPGGHNVPSVMGIFVGEQS